MGNIKVTKFDKLRKHYFYIFNKDKRKAGVKMFKASNKLVNVQPPFYMDKAQIREFFLWMVHESGYYIKAGQKPEIRPKKTRFKRDDKGRGNQGIYNPNFED